MNKVGAMARRPAAATAALTLLATAGTAAAQPATPAGDPTWPTFRGLYEELVETNTTLSVGSCTAAAEKMAKRLTDAGYPAADVRVLVPEGRPKDGALIAVLPGSDARLKPVLLLAHIDVVEANRADWTRDPFTLVEEGGFFYARGASDDKAMAAIFVDSLIRYRQEGLKPKRGLKLALTCGEETADTFNGVDHLLKTDPAALDAEFALNEGGGGKVDAAGKPVALSIQVGEKIYQDYQLEVTNPGGHSSRPVQPNAIVQLANALAKIGAHRFPLELNEVVRSNFAQPSADDSPDTAAAKQRLAISAQPIVPEAAEIVAAANPTYNAMLRTTCTPTTVAAGHAPNALPQRATANINCRILPGHTPAETLATLQQVVADPAVKVTLAAEPSAISKAPPLSDRVLGPARQAAAKVFPGLTLTPFMSTGATDSRYLNAAGIPSYGLSGILSEADGSNYAHGLNERLRVQSLYDGRRFLFEVVKLYGAQ